MSLERIFKALVNLGFSLNDARVYIYLASKGSRKAKELINSLQISKRQIYRSLKNLQNKKIVITNGEHPAEFSALPFEKVLEILIDIKEEQAQKIRNKKNNLLASWQKMDKK